MSEETITLEVTRYRPGHDREPRAQSRVTGHGLLEAGARGWPRGWQWAVAGGEEVLRQADPVGPAPRPP